MHQQSEVNPDSAARDGTWRVVIVLAVAVLVFLVAFGALAAGYYSWLQSDPTRGEGDTAARFAVRLPNPDNAPKRAENQEPPVGVFEVGSGEVATRPDGWGEGWPQFRGPNRDGVVTDPDRKLARQFGPDGPPRLWSTEIGKGYAGPVVHRGRVYMIDYDEEAQRDAVRCLSLEDGREIWRVSYPVEIKPYHGMTRTVPAVSDDVLVTLGPKCHVMAVDPITGEQLWSLNLVGQYDTIVPEWYAGQCPLIDGDKVIIAPGGVPDPANPAIGEYVLMMALDARTGSTLWQTPNTRRWKMSHTSIMPMTVDGVKMYVYATHEGGLVGIDAETGEELWATEEWRVKVATVCSPVVVPGDRIFMADGYGAGCAMFQVSRDDGGNFKATKLYHMREKVFGVVQQTAIYYDGYIYGVSRATGQLKCLDLEANTMWESGRQQGFGLGPLIIANGVIYLMRDGEARGMEAKDGELVLVEATPEGFRLLAEHKVTWKQATKEERGGQPLGPMALAGTRLLVRDLTTLICLDVGEK